MRESVASIALIQRDHDGHRQWLAQWNENWQRYSFVGGHKHPDESFRQCVIRETAEELQLAEGIDFFVADQPLAHLDYTAWSESSRQQTHYQMELFAVQLAGEAAQRKVNADPRNRWLTEDEIRARHCTSGELVSDTISLLLTKANLISERLD
jgi:8-oxo-dGTP pyrophosphatase MutT (NUDIX family)